jgi:transposase
MRPNGTPEQLAKRRRRAIELVKSGKNLSEAADVVSANPGSVSRWWREYQQKGLKGLNPQPASGRPNRLDLFQKEKLLGLLLEGSVVQGYTTDLWTLNRVGRLIRKYFGVTYHRCHIWKLLTSLGLSCQKPERRALQRDEAAIEHWKRYKWPHIKKRKKDRGQSGLPRRKWIFAHP